MDEFEARLKHWQRAEELACTAEQHLVAYTGEDPGSIQLLQLQANSHREKADALLQAALIEMQRLGRTPSPDTIHALRPRDSAPGKHDEK